MAALKARFVARAGDDLAVLRAGAGAAQMQVLIHRLSGTAGAFGFAELSRLAAVVDDRLHVGEPPAATDMAALLRELESVSLMHG